MNPKVRFETVTPEERRGFASFASQPSFLGRLQCRLMQCDARSDIPHDTNSNDDDANGLRL